MSLSVYYEKDVDRGLLSSRRIAILGYGSQGRSHALNLRDNGYQVIVAQRQGGANYKRALDDGFSPISISQAVPQADLLIHALPDEVVGDIFSSEIATHLRPGQALGFIHGFAIRFGTVKPPAHVDVIMVAPKGPGPLVREAFIRGGGLTCLIAVAQNATSHARSLALAWGAGIGGGRGGMIETTFAQECESDLFGEQTVLCGGMIELMKAAYDILVEAGYPPEVAYLECIHEAKQIVDMQYTAGLEGMRSKISRTAAYGGLTRGPRMVTPEVRAAMRSILDEIRSGKFAEDWLAECRAGKPRLRQLANSELAHPSEDAGRRVREAAKNAIVRDIAAPPQNG